MTTRLTTVHLGTFTVGLALLSLDHLSVIGIKLPNSASHLLGQIGHAMLIAPIVALVVDQAARREALIEFAENVSSRIIGRLLPRELQDHIIEYLSSDFVTTNWKINYFITSWPSNQEYVQLVTNFTYTVENRSKKSRAFDVTFLVERSFHPNVGEAKIVRVSARDQSREHFHLSGAALEALVTHKDNGDIFFSRSVEVRPDPGGSLEVYAESLECYKDSSFSAFMTRHPVLSSEITINYPKEEFKMEVFLSSQEDSGLVMDEMLTGTSWRARGPLLPGQGYFARWERIARSGKAREAATGG